MLSRILVAGASGLLGSNLLMMNKGRFKMMGISNRHIMSYPGCESVQLDLRIPEVLSKWSWEPDCIINCAALTDGDYCELHPDEARRVNIDITANLLQLAANTKSYFIQISTDAVFDGQRGNYREGDPTAPLNQYGDTKLAAERLVVESGLKAAVARTNIYGWNALEKKSLGEFVISKLRANEEIRGIQDAVFSPILVNHLADILFSVAELKYKGILHIAGSESLSKFDFARQVADVFGYPDANVRPAQLVDFAFKAKRGRNLSLNTDAAQNALNRKFPGVREGLIYFRDLVLDGYVQRLKEGVRHADACH